MWTKHGEIDESLLQVRRDVEIHTEENGYEVHVVPTEYCYANCDGIAHTTGVSDAEGCFCSKHVKRGVDAYIIKAPGAESVLQAM